MQIKELLIWAIVLMAIASCRQKEPIDSGTQNRKFIDRANMDTTIKPGDDFYLYTNGSWLKNNPIPETEANWGTGNVVGKKIEEELHFILDSLAAIKNAASGSLAQKVGDFYRTGMDSDAINKEGLKPIKEILEHIDKIKDAEALKAEIAYQYSNSSGVIFSFGIFPDSKNVTKEICQFGQGGLGLPGREYYFDNDENTAKIRDAYKQYITQILMRLGEEKAKAIKDAAEIYKLELSLASASMSNVELRDQNLQYNKFDLDGITKLTPGLDWKVLLSRLKITGEDSVIVNSPKFFTELSRLLNNTPVETWKNYLRVQYVSTFATYLSVDIDTLNFNFYGKLLGGQTKQEPRWKRILGLVDGCEGELLGQIYVNKTFKPEAKKRMLELVDNLQKIFAERLHKLDWMTEDTKKKALFKLNAIAIMIGYPDRWRDYSALKIGDKGFLNNLFAVCQWGYNHNINKLGKPVDRTEWPFTPPTINCGYTPSFNHIVFPAGILQFPFFDLQADDAVNYGAIGGLIGHEMTHGFDDIGREFDAVGNLSNWWVSQDSANFVSRANKVVDMFNKIIVIDTIHANGKLSEGENVADLGGLGIAYQAFKKTKQGQSNEKIEGFTPDQRFFLSWAQTWRCNIRPEYLATLLKTDPHSPSPLRCNVPVSNMDAWYKAFDIKPTDKLYRPENERVKIW